MSNIPNYLQLEAEILRTLKTIYDPEIPVNIYDLGLIYKIDVDGENNVEVDMTLTAPNCPIADSLLADVQDQVSRVKNVNHAVVRLVFDPPWSPERMTEEAKLELGFL